MINAKVKRKHRNSYKLIYTALFICTLLAYLLTNDLFYSYVCYWNDRFYANPQWNPDKRYKAGIIMGGFGYMDKSTGKIGYVMYSENRTQNGIRPDMRNRLWRAISLWKEGHLEKILITGDMVANIHKDGTSEKNLFLHYMKKYARVPPEVFVFEQQSKNTYENVLFTSEILKQREITGPDCLLITTASHVGRSLKCFSEQGIDIDYFSVDARKPLMISGNWWQPDIRILKKWEELLYEWGGIMVYWLKGYI